MAGSRGMLKLELDLARASRGFEEGSSPAILLWPKSPTPPPEIVDAIVVQLDGDSVHLRAPGARLTDRAVVGEWSRVHGVRVRLSWGMSVGDTQTFDLATASAGTSNGAHIELRVPGAESDWYTLPTSPGTRVTIGARSARADLELDDQLTGGTICRISFDGKDYRMDSPSNLAMASLNGKEVFWPETLREGDRILLGDVSLRFTSSAGDQPSTPITPKVVVEPVQQSKVQRGGGRWKRIAGISVLVTVFVALTGFLVYMGSQLW